MNRKPVSAEIAVLRVLIRRMIGAGQLEGARRGIETLSRVLQSRAAQPRSSDRFPASLERVLDQLGLDEPEETA